MKKIEIQQRKNMQAVLETQENERRSIAKEVHDNLSPLLSITHMQVETVIERITDKETRRLLEEVQQQLKYALFTCRDISHELTPFLNEHSNLHETINDYVVKVRNTQKINIYYQYNLTSDTIIHYQKSASICRIILELISNTLKHAHAKTIVISINKSDKDFLLRYSDDGIGIQESRVNKGIGLRNIESRVMLLTGQLYFGPLKNKTGHEVTITIPLRELS